MDTIGVGIIGASPDGWASFSHVPALKALPGYELRAVGTSRRASAEAAAERFGVAAAFDDHEALIAHPGVDLVVVASTVTRHHEHAAAALAAGKMVYCEWPLARGRAEAEDLAARAAGRRTVIGLQARYAPAVRHARDLVAGGYVGEVLGTTLIGSSMSWGGETDRAHAHLFDAATGLTPLTVSAAHALEAIEHVLGGFAAVSGNLVTARTRTRIADDDTTIPVTVPDQVSVTGRLAGGAALSLFYRGGWSRGENLRWEINGTEGDLVLRASGPNGNLQTRDLVLEGGRGGDDTVHEISVPGSYFHPVPRGLEGPAQNVAQVYVALARDLRDGTRTVPGFDHALERHRLVHALERQQVSAAPAAR
ncbi:Gfo/Idh/MocA family protein [Herbidospora yilanensis]|uniref:Gfo/Idh/MocA family protein n=1 Tax=Herbidospora yilanensis TaxID=354426 RepID=UPI0007C64887|nr:Gfo/Idh/MocA family oxidoreductase [Herbidospora yilanensis]